MLYGILVLVGIAVVLGIWVVAAYNSLVSRGRKKDEAWSGVLVQLKRRHDLIPNLVSVVKGYATHEKGLFEELARARSLPANAPVDDLARSESGFTQALGRLFAVAENYPELKASANFADLQASLSGIEEAIQMARRYYNGTVRDYNILVSSFPGLLVARRFGFTESPYFELESAAESAVPRVEM